MKTTKNAGKPKRGRPFSGGREPMRSLRCDDATWSKARRDAERAGVSLSEWIRRLIMGGGTT